MTNSVLVKFDQDDYLSLLEKTPDLSRLFHELGQMIIRGELDPPRVAPLPPPPKNVKRETSVRESLLGSLFAASYDIVQKRDGEWVSWQDLRPALRYRDAYGERIWQLFEEDPDTETRSVPHGARVRRAVRFAPLV